MKERPEKDITYSPYFCFKMFRSTVCFWNALPHWIQDPVWSSVFISYKRNESQNQNL